ncbi:hypothetical protein BDZ45DRAFT_739728 [Acephala macrosclerotiorum]|nr:hypothetical protein BDZ45DRAFT_739728 [Acephala macrosclerotiorum]
MSFTSFLKLSCELRKQIWEDVCSVERVLDIRPILAVSQLSLSFIRKLNNGMSDDVTIAFRAYSRNAPSVLRVSSESRFIGFKYYELGFSSSFNRDVDGASVKITTEPRIYVNWEYHIIYPLIEWVREGAADIVADSICRQLQQLPESRIAIPWHELGHFDWGGVGERLLGIGKEVTVCWTPPHFWRDQSSHLSKPTPFQIICLEQYHEGLIFPTTPQRLKEMFLHMRIFYIYVEAHIPRANLNLAHLSPLHFRPMVIQAYE